jgi:hypothetical protein
MTRKLAYARFRVIIIKKVGGLVRKDNFMKKFSKLLALLMAMVMACAFVGCKNSDDDDNKSSSPTVSSAAAVAVFTGTVKGSTVTFTFRTDKTADFLTGNVVNGTGIYEGDPTTDGTVTFKKPDGSQSATLTIANGKFTFGGVEFTRKVEVVATFTSSDPTKGSATFTFSSDKTFKAVADASGQGIASGTYTGDPTKDGTVTISGEKEGETETLTIASGKFTWFGAEWTKK